VASSWSLEGANSVTFRNEGKGNSRNERLQAGLLRHGPAALTFQQDRLQPMTAWLDNLDPCAGAWMSKGGRAIPLIGFLRIMGTAPFTECYEEARAV